MEGKDVTNIQPISEHKTEQQQINETMQKIEAQWRVKTYMELLIALEIDPKKKGHDHVIRILKKVVLGHGDVIADGTKKPPNPTM